MRSLLVIALSAILTACASFAPAPPPADTYQLTAIGSPPDTSGVQVAVLDPIDPSAAQLSTSLSAGQAPSQRGAVGTALRSARVGSCDCPYDRKSNGAMCGAGSAWSKPGGKSPA